MVSKKRLLGAALVGAAVVGVTKLKGRKSTGEIISITPGKEMVSGDIVEIRDLKSRALKPVKISLPLGVGEDFEVGEKVTFIVDRNPRHKLDGVAPGKLLKLG